MDIKLTDKEKIRVSDADDVLWYYAAYFIAR